MADSVHTGPLVRLAEAQRAVLVSVFRGLHAVRELFGTSRRNMQSAAISHHQITWPSQVWHNDISGSRAR